MFRKVALAVAIVMVVSFMAVGATSRASATIKPPGSPTITEQPQTVTVKYGRTAHFKVQATGNPKPTYQWQVSSGGGPFGDVASASTSLFVTASTTDDGDMYRVIVSNPSGAETSNVATLTVSPSKLVTKAKPFMVGLIDKGVQGPYDASQPFPVTPTAELNGYASAFSGTVANVTWAQLEPSEGDYDFTPLESDLAAVSAYNAGNPAHPLQVKLRVWGGFTAPAWAKSLDGPPINVPGDAGRPDIATLGRYWLADYEQQWADLQSALAKKFDKNSLINQVAVTSCNSETGEPFVTTETDILALLAAGWTSANQQQCLDGALDGYSAWKHTAVDFTFNGFSDVSSTGVRSPDDAVTAAIMAECASSEITGQGPLCILDNHGLQDSVSSQQEVLYAGIDSLWQQFGHDLPVDFQTFSPNVDLCQTIGVGVAYHAQSIEVWPPGPGFSGFRQYTPAQLTSWDQALIDENQPVCS